MSEHTAGPWKIIDGVHNGYDCRVVSPAGDAELGNWLVAGVRWKENARLIAAAPDLLEALNGLLECHPGGSEKGSPVFIARAAISKATSTP